MKRVHCLAHFILLFGLCAGSVSAQDMRDHWVFGPGNYVHFEGGEPVFKGSVPMSTREGVSSLSDTLGQLQAYAFPGATFNAEFDTMLNGLARYPCTDLATGSTVTQGTMLLPGAQPGSLINLFSINGDSLGCEQQYLYHKKVVLEADEGLGAVLEAGLNDPVTNLSVSEQLTAIRHGNGDDWWIIVRNALPPFYTIGNSFHIFLLANDSLLFAGQFETTVSSKLGELVASPDGHTLALANGVDVGDSMSQGLMLFDFDRCEGIISNERVLDFNRNTYGVAFSTSGRFLYMGIYDGTADYCGIVQVDLSDTALPFQVVYDCSASSSITGALEIGPNGKIYFVLPFCTTVTSDTLHWFLHSIESPDNLGPACSIQPYRLALQSGFNCYASLPNHPNYYLGADPNNCGDTTTSVAEPILDVGWKVYPTVAQQAFVIELPPDSWAEAWIVDAVGRVMKRETISPGKTSIDVSQWPSGMYRVALQQEGNYLGAKTVVRP